MFFLVLKALNQNSDPRMDPWMQQHTVDKLGGSILGQLSDFLNLYPVSSEPGSCLKDFNMNIFLFFCF